VALIRGNHEVVDVDPTDEKTAITKLKLMGFKVFVSHRRWIDGQPVPAAKDIAPAHTAFKIKRTGFRPAPKGGATIVRITDADGAELASATAYCSLGDNFNRQRGTQIALGRAVKELAQLAAPLR
jgi:hypothetical protein